MKDGLLPSTNILLLPSKVMPYLFSNETAVSIISLKSALTNSSAYTTLTKPSTIIYYTYIRLTNLIIIPFFDEIYLLFSLCTLL